MDTGEIRLTIAGVDVTQFVRTVNWSGNYENCARELSAGVIQSHADPYLPVLNTAVGSPVSFSIDGETVFTGTPVPEPDAGGDYGGCLRGTGHQHRGDGVRRDGGIPQLPPGGDGV